LFLPKQKAAIYLVFTLYRKSLCFLPVLFLIKKGRDFTELLEISLKGACRAVFFSKNAVSFYLAISPLPFGGPKPVKGGIFSVALSIAFRLPDFSGLIIP